MHCSPKLCATRKRPKTNCGRWPPKLRVTLAPLKSLCATLGVPDALARLRQLSSKSFLVSEEKNDFRLACRILQDGNTRLREALSVALPALDELADANYNRLDMVRASLTRHRDIYCGVVSGTDDE